MFDVGWSELFLIMAVAVLVIGPDQLPPLMVTVGRIVRRLRFMRFALTQQFEDMMRDHGMDDIRTQVNFEDRPRPVDAKGFDEESADEEYLTTPENAAEDPAEQDPQNEERPHVAG